jgi:hypothetical protein
VKRICHIVIAVQQNNIPRYRFLFWCSKKRNSKKSKNSLNGISVGYFGQKESDISDTPCLKSLIWVCAMVDQVVEAKMSQSAPSAWRVLAWVPVR